MGEPQGAGAAASPSRGSPADRAGMILTPDQRVRVFISSTLEELAAERAAARRVRPGPGLIPHRDQVQPPDRAPRRRSFGGQLLQG